MISNGAQNRLFDIIAGSLSNIKGEVDETQSRGLISTAASATSLVKFVLRSPGPLM